MMRSLFSFTQYICDRLQCSLQCKYNAIINTSKLVNLESCNSKNMLKVFEGVPHLILISCANMSANHSRGVYTEVSQQTRLFEQSSNRRLKSG